MAMSDTDKEVILKKIILNTAKTFAENKVSFNDSVPISTAVMLELLSHSLTSIIDHIAKNPQEYEGNLEFTKNYSKSMAKQLIDAVRLSVSTELDMIESNVNTQINSIGGK